MSGAARRSHIGAATEARDVARAAQTWSYLARREARQEGIMATGIGTMVRRAWWSLVIRGLLAIAVGIFIFARPLASVAALALVIAIWAIVQGVVDIVHAIGLRGVVQHWGLPLLGGIVSVGFGVAALYYYPALSLGFMVVWTSWWLVLLGAVGTWIAVQERRAGVPWGWTMAWGVLSVVAGIVALLTPPITLAALMGFIAAFAVVSGAALLVAAFRVRQATDEVGAALGMRSAT
jgi:uncharacterized membrane protein HdeD (DUF308 family)